MNIREEEGGRRFGADLWSRDHNAMQLLFGCLTPRNINLDVSKGTCIMSSQQGRRHSALGHSRSSRLHVSGGEEVKPPHRRSIADEEGCRRRATIVLFNGGC